jgi:hypothetical protein
MSLSTDHKYLAHEFTATLSLYSVIHGWNVGTIRGAVDAHDVGASFILSGGLSVVASRWPAIFGPLGQRKAPPLGLQREVTGGDRGAARRAKDGFARVMSAQETSFGDIFDAHAMMGFQILQHTWKPAADASTLEPTTKLWPAACTWFNPLSRKLEAITMDGRWPIEDGDGHWSIVGTGEQPFRNGAIRALGETWAAGRGGERDEAALSAYLGRLCPIGILPSAIEPGSPAGDNFLQAIKDLGEAQSGGIFPSGSDVKTLPNIDAGAAGLFAGFLTRRERAAAIALLGTDGTVSAGSPGVYVSPLFGAVAFAKVREDTAHAGGAYTRLGAAYGAINYGLSAEESPGYRWLLPDPTEAARRKAEGDTLLQAAAIVKAEREAGVDITPTRIGVIYSRLGVPVPAIPETSAKGQIFAYHIEQNIVAPDQVLETLGLPALPGGVGTPASLAAHILAVRAAELEAAQGAGAPPAPTADPAPAGA